MAGDRTPPSKTQSRRTVQAKQSPAPPAPTIPRPRGRRCKLDKRLINNAVELQRLGVPQETVAQKLRIGVTTWFRWLQEGEAVHYGHRELHGKPIAEPDLKRELWEAVDEARATAEIALVSYVREAARGSRDPSGKLLTDENGRPVYPVNVRAATWALEHLYPDKYRTRVALEGSPDRPLEVSVKVLGFDPSGYPPPGSRSSSPAPSAAGDEGGASA